MKRFKRSYWLILVLLLAGLAAGGFFWLFGNLPAPQEIDTRLHTPSIRITDRNGKILYEALAQDAGRHAVVPLEQIPINLQQATIATEDSQFYSNPGVDLRGILRAVWLNLRGSQTLVGGSTITQQVARNLLLSAEERSQRSVRRKLREIYLAWELTRHYSKDEILALYLNQTYYGGMAYGVEAAAQTFFGKPVAELDLAEAAVLAGLPQTPALYNPLTHPDAAKERQKVVLRRMQEDGYISAGDQAQAEREKLVYASTPYPMQAPHFVMMVRSQIDELFSQDEIYNHGGLVVRTSLDLDWQGHAEDAIARQIEALKSSPDGLGHNLNNAALVALDPNNGDILALVGSPDYFDSEHAGAINMALAPRQPGSALKPIVYATAFDPTRPDPWTAATMLLDVRTTFTTHDGQPYTPANYDLLEHGPVLARQALASSLNIPAVLTLDHLGLKALFDQAERMGISTLGDPDNYDLSLALGGGEVRLLELTAAYGIFANTGFRVQPRAILEVKDPQGNTLYNAPPVSKVRVLDERVAWLISDILSDNDARMLGFGPNSLLRLDRTAAVKTGTTSNFHDNWTIGYTPDLVVGVWAGNTSYEPMRGVNGLSGAGPIWHQFMRTVLTGQPDKAFSRPPDMVQEQVCILSGLLPGPDCPYKRLEWFISGTQPKQTDNLYRAVEIDKRTGRLAQPNTPPGQVERQVVLDLPPSAQVWAHNQGITLYSDVSSGLANGQVPVTGNSAAAISLVSPANGSLYRLSTDFDPSAQQIHLLAVGEPGLKSITMWLDGAQVATFSGDGPYETWQPLTPGKHQAWAEALRQDGEKVRSESASFEVQLPNP